MPSPASPRDPAGVTDDATRRVTMARAAESAIAAVDQVRPTVGALGRWRTLDGDRWLDGIVAIEGGDGRVELVLHLDAVWPPPRLTELADEVRLGIAPSSVNGALGDVRVFFHDVVLPGAPVGAR